MTSTTETLTTETSIQRTDQNPARKSQIAAFLSIITGGALGVLRQAGEMIELLLEVTRTAVAHPRGYWGATREQMYLLVKLCWFPSMLSTACFCMDGPGTVGGGLYNLFGMPERLGSFLNMASVREIAPFVNMMVVAGVMGSAITADLGARRIREEFDALEVLGVDPVREIIVPRVIAITLMTAALDVLASVAGVLGGAVAEYQLQGNISFFTSSFWANATQTDMWTTVVKSALYGLIIGVISCYKGYRAEGGAAGVGRAVNQSVVIAFAVVWVVHYAVTTLILGFNPDMMVYR